MSFTISLITFGLFLVGLVLIGNLSPNEMSEDLIQLMSPKKSIKKRAEQRQKKKKDGFFRQFLKDTDKIMKFMGQSGKFTIVCVLAVLLAAFGVIISIYLNNLWLIPAFAIGFCSLPFLFVHMYSFTYARHLQNELETTLSQITISYLRTNDIVRSVEENIDNINAPIRAPFEEFLAQIKFVNPNERQAIDDLSAKIDNDIFAEWCDSLKKCASNRSLKYLLTPSLNKFSTLRSIENKIKPTLASIKMQFFIIVGIVYANLPMLKYMNKDWYNVLFETTQGNICIGLVALITVITTIMCIFLTKPIRYKL